MALARRVREGGSWLVRISLAQTGRWLVERGQVPVADLKEVPKDFAPEELEQWTMATDTPFGRLHHLGPVICLSETQHRWAAFGAPRPPRAGMAGEVRVAAPGLFDEKWLGPPTTVPGAN